MKPFPSRAAGSSKSFSTHPVRHSQDCRSAAAATSTDADNSSQVTARRFYFALKDCTKVTETAVLAEVRHAPAWILVRLPSAPDTPQGRSNVVGYVRYKWGRYINAVSEALQGTTRPVRARQCEKSVLEYFIGLGGSVSTNMTLRVPAARQQAVKARGAHNATRPAALESTPRKQKRDSAALAWTTPPLPSTQSNSLSNRPSVPSTLLLYGGANDVQRRRH